MSMHRPSQVSISLFFSLFLLAIQVQLGKIASPNHRSPTLMMRRKTDRWIIMWATPRPVYGVLQASKDPTQRSGYSLHLCGVSYGYVYTWSR